MRVAVIHNLRKGGALRVLAEQARRMDGDVVEFCLGTATPVTAGARVIPYEPRAPGVPRALRPTIRHTDFVALVAAWRRLAVAVRAGSFDVVLAHPCTFLQGPAALPWLTDPIVYFCHESRRIDYEPAAERTRNPRTRRLYWVLRRAERTVDRRAVQAAGTLVTNSHHTARMIRSAYGRDATPLPLGVAEVFDAGEVPQAPRHLLTVGSLIPTKGHDLVVRAAALAERRRPVVVVAPRADPAEEDRLRALADECGVELDIRVAVTDEELRDCYRQAFATLYLAQDEPFGLASIEAQACGSPVIVSDEGGLPETLVEDVTGWISAREPARAAALIDRLEDADRRAAMATRAAAHGSARTWTAATAALQEVLESAARR